MSSNKNEFAVKVGDGVTKGVDATIKAGTSIFNWGKSKVNKVLDERQKKKEAMITLQDELFKERIKAALEDYELDLTTERKEELYKEFQQRMRDNLAAELHRGIDDARKSKVNPNLTAGQIARMKELEATQKQFYANKAKKS